MTDLAKTDTSPIDRPLINAVENGTAAGVVAMAVDETGVTYEGAFGKRQLGDGADASTDTVFWIASMTKAVTSVAAMQLVEHGALDLDKAARDVVPAIGEAAVLDGFGADGSPRLRPPIGEVTLRQLLTHTAGFAYDMWNANIGRYVEQLGLPGIITCQEAALGLPLTFDPGAQWSYGINTDWVGKMVEAASGQTLDAYFKQHIFEPLGMTETGFIIRDDQRPRLSAMHARTPDGGLASIDFEMPQDPEFFMGGGGLYSVAGDYARFLRMILGEGTLDGTTVLKPETVADMARNQIGDIEMPVMRSAIPDYTNDVDIFPGMVKKWGLGFMINTEDAPTGRSAGSLAWAGLANTYYWIDPRARVAGVILTQTLPFADTQTLELLGAFENAVYDAARGNA